MYSPTQYFLTADNTVRVDELFSCVLIVEPDPNTAQQLNETFNGSFCELTIAGSGKQALEIFQTTFLELLIVSAAVDDISAAEIAATASYYRPGLPVVVISRPETCPNALQAMREGAWDYVLSDGEGRFCAQVLKDTIERAAMRKVDAMQQIEASSEQSALFAAMQTAQDGTAIVGPTGIISQANEVFADFCRLLQPEGSTGGPLNLLELIERIDRRAAHDLLTELRCHGSSDAVWRTELKIPDGDRERVVEFNLSTVTVNGTSELTPRNSAVPELRRHVVWVRDITRRRMRELFEKQLLSSTTHDLKGPLGSITCAAELIDNWDCELPTDVRRLVHRIYSCARRSLIEIDTLLKARAVEADALTIKPRRCCLEEIFEDVCDNYQLIAEAEQIALIADPPGVQSVFADKAALVSVLNNLLGNAIKYTPRGGKVQLSADQQEDAVRIAVIDNGPGIDPRKQHLLFEPFVRGDDHAEIEGSGLGLFIAKSLVEAHGGYLEVQSYLGSGTCFILHLPLEPQEADTAQ